MSESRVDARGRHAFAEEDDMRLQDAAAVLARRDVHGGVIDIRDSRIAIRSDRLWSRFGELWIAREEARLKAPPIGQRAAPEALHGVEAAVQIDHAAAACPRVQAVDVLRDDRADQTGRLEPRERDVCAIRRGPGDALPSNEAARPIAPPDRRLGHELLIHYRPRMLPLAVEIAIVRNSRFSRAAGAGEHENAPMARQEFRKPIDDGVVHASLCRDPEPRGG